MIIFKWVILNGKYTIIVLLLSILCLLSHRKFKINKEFNAHNGISLIGKFSNYNGYCCECEIVVR